MSLRSVRRPCAALSAAANFSSIPAGRVRNPSSAPVVGRARSPRMAAAFSYHERTVFLPKPLGIELKELDGGGVRFEAFTDGGAAASAAFDVDIAPGDRLLRVGGADVATMGLDAVTQLLAESDSPLELTVDDGLGSLDIPAKLALRPEEAVYADLVVRMAVREIRRRVGADPEQQRTLGELLGVETILSAVCPDRRCTECTVAFFGIFSTDGGGTTYSSNVSATGKRGGGSIAISALSMSTKPPAKNEYFEQKA